MLLASVCLCLYLHLYRSAPLLSLICFQRFAFVYRSYSICVAFTFQHPVCLSVCLCLSVFLYVCLPVCVCVYFCLFVCRFPPPLSISVSLWSGLIPQWHQRRALSSHCVVSHWSTMIDAVLCCSNRSSAHRQTKEKNLNSTKEPFNNNRWRRCLSVYVSVLSPFVLSLFVSVCLYMSVCLTESVSVSVCLYISLCVEVELAREQTVHPRRMHSEASDSLLRRTLPTEMA